MNSLKLGRLCAIWMEKNEPEVFELIEDECFTDKYAKNKRWREKQKKNRRCVRCGGQLGKWKSRCDECHEKQKKYFKSEPKVSKSLVRDCGESGLSFIGSEELAKPLFKFIRKGKVEYDNLYE